MCRSQNDPDGPKTCTGHARAPFAAAASSAADIDTKIAVTESALMPDDGTTPLPAHPEIKLTNPQQSGDPAVYADPYPGMKGKDQVKVMCDGCAGTGIYHGPTPYYQPSPYQKNVTIPAHFRCQGLGFKTILVSSARSSARTKVKAHVEAIESKKLAAEKAAKEAVEKERAERERRAALVQGHVGEIGDKVGGLQGTVVVSKTYESSYGYRKTLKKFLTVKLDNGQVVTTGGSGQSLFTAKPGASITIMSGTVKGHSVYQGQDQTELTRVKILAAE